MDFEKDLKDKLIAEMKDVDAIVAQEESNEMDIKEAISYNLAISKCISILSDAEKKELEEKFLNLTSDIVFHKFNKAIMEERKLISFNSSKEKTFTEVSIELDDDVFEHFQNILEDNSVSASDFVNDVLYDLVLQLSHKEEANGLEVIDSVYMAHHIDNLLDSNKDYLVINYETKEKVVLMTNRDSINTYELLKDK